MGGRGVVARGESYVVLSDQGTRMVESDEKGGSGSRRHARQTHMYIATIVTVRARVVSVRAWIEKRRERGETR